MAFSLICARTRSAPERSRGRSGFAAFYFVVAVCLGGCSATAAPQTRTTLYECADGRTFTVRSDPYDASVAYDDEHYRLTRRPSSIGTKYASTEATLIVDGNFAAFATETVVDLNQCFESK